jgi:hypothetical protein
VARTLYALSKNPFDLLDGSGKFIGGDGWAEGQERRLFEDTFGQLRPDPKLDRASVRALERARQPGYMERQSRGATAQSADARVCDLICEGEALAVEGLREVTHDARSSGVQRWIDWIVIFKQSAVGAPYVMGTMPSYQCWMGWFGWMETEANPRPKTKFRYKPRTIREYSKDVKYWFQSVWRIVDATVTCGDAWEKALDGIEERARLRYGGAIPPEDVRLPLTAAMVAELLSLARRYVRECGEDLQMGMRNQTWSTALGVGVCWTVRFGEITKGNKDPLSEFRWEHVRFATKEVDFIELEDLADALSEGRLHWADIMWRRTKPNQKCMVRIQPCEVTGLVGDRGTDHEFPLCGATLLAQHAVVMMEFFTDGQGALDKEAFHKSFVFRQFDKAGQPAGPFPRRSVGTTLAHHLRELKYNPKLYTLHIATRRLAKTAMEHAGFENDVQAFQGGWKLAANGEQSAAMRCYDAETRARGGAGVARAILASSLETRDILVWRRPDGMGR